MSEISAYHEAGHAFMAIFVGALLVVLSKRDTELLHQVFDRLQRAYARCRWLRIAACKG